MDGLTLLRQAAAEGLEVQADGDRLIVRGPVRLEPLAHIILEHKAEVLPFLRWDQGLADRLLRETLQRVAALFNPTWGTRYRADRHWLEPIARFEAARLTRDMAAFVLALADFEEFARATFAEYARADGGNQHR